MKLILMVVAISVLSGCASSKAWYHTGKGLPERRKDYAECQYEADKYTNVDFGGGFPAQVEANIKRNNLYGQCLTLRGYGVFEMTDIQRMESERNTYDDKKDIRP